MKLSKSQRIKFIRDISKRLEPETWTEIDLVLKQFYLPTSDQWNGGKDAYVVKMIEDSNDSDLSELAEHFGIITKEGNGQKDEDFNSHFWEDGKLKVFISHLTAHREQASKLKNALSRWGMGCFVAHNDIHPTLEWQIEIEAALSTCDLLIALIHPGFKDSSWCDQEIGYALGRGIPVFSIKCGADPHGFVSRFQAFNGQGKAESSIGKEIFEHALRHKKLQDKIAYILVNMFANSGSFSDAKTRIALLERLEVWDDSFNAIISDALKKNSQIYDSWGVPDQVRKLLAKWK
ncbi:MULTISPECIES: toll/interleukin-1 receptor domain-containing protein [unclassified Xanthobacter]|uniref:toll/interleukin-1 receptor domain-containing protein n=1 Tax=unclassified Xanthobacter TaxID=2623496 RepID=UPI001EE12273|nr:MULTISPECIES: toll/interleukin-1 receptor domain-containing protein [unclassified Xanthobacter]